MTSAEDSHRETLRARIKDKIRSVPAKVNSGSVQMARNFKDFHLEASRALDARNVSTQKLQDIYTKTLSWYS